MRSPLNSLAGWLKNSFIDFPGTVSTVLFFAGCNLRCPYCHNSSFVYHPPDISEESDMIWNFLEKRKQVIDGVVISGGEPTCHDHVASIITYIKKIGYKVKLDTNGLLPEKIKLFSPDYLALDIKTIPFLYCSLLHAPYALDEIEARLRQSLTYVQEMGDKAEVRITLAPGLINANLIAKMKNLLHGIRTVYLQPVQLNQDILNPTFFKGQKLFTHEEIQAFRDQLQEVVHSCRIR